jgi:AsmA protein
MNNPFVRWIVLILGALVALAALGAGALAYLVSRIDVRAEVERAVENATGRDLTIAGDVGISLWPVLGLHAADASLANIEGGRALALAAMDDIHIGVEIRPLFDREVVVRQLVLQHPRIALEVDAQGQSNWRLAPRASPSPAPAPAPHRPAAPERRFSLQEIRTEGGEVSYYDARRGTGWVIGEANLTTALTSLNLPMRIEGDVRYADQQLALAIEIAAPRAAFAGRGTAVKLNIASELLTADFTGATTAASGEMQGLVTAGGPSLRRLAAWTGTPLQGASGLEAFAVSGRLDIGGGLFSFTNATFALDRLSGRGDFSVSQLRGKPYLSGRLELFDFDLNPYLPGQTPPPAAAAPAEAVALPPAGAALEPPASTAEIAVVEAPTRALDVTEAPSDAPIDFSSLRAINADLELTTHAVLVQRLRIDRSVVALVLNDGFLASTLHSVSLYGGSATGRMEIDAREASARMVQDISVQGVDAQRFLSDAFNFGNIEGRAELAVNLRLQGRTQSELISSADGGAHIEVVSGVLRGVDLGGVSRTIRNALRGELIAPEARTPFNGFSATFAVADGALASDNLSFNTPNLRIPGLGVIDLTQRRLDMRLAPRASSGGGIVIPFSARGPWAQIVYTSDIRDIALREITTRVREVQAASRPQAR